jgi:CRP-like cAMP-binding protein
LSGNVVLEKYARKTDKKALAKAMKTESLRVQSHLFKQGAPADRLYIIVSGQANVRSAV